MSVNITVNGKFATPCHSHKLLIDPNNARKTEELERRKLRLLQVREESKKLAKKIRDEVNEEKKRELQKLQATKEKEMECWRQHALHRKGEEYSAAIFQIGTAHDAARRENKSKDDKLKQTKGSYKDFKKQMAARKCQPGKVQFDCQPFCPCQQTQTGANKQFKCICKQTEEKHFNDKQEAHKRKRDFNHSSSESECEDESIKNPTNIPLSSFSLSSSDGSLSSNKYQADQTSMFVPIKNKCLIKTPSVYLDVEVGTDDSVTISAPAEVKDRHAEYNRQFSSIIRLSPRKVQQRREKLCKNSSVPQSLTATTATSSSETTAKEQEKNMSSLEESQNPSTQQILTTTLSGCTSATQQSKNKIPLPQSQNITNGVQVLEKRFTIISELVKKQQETYPRAMANNRIESFPPVSQATSTTLTPNLSPKKQLRDTPFSLQVPRSAGQSTQKTSATSKSSRTAITQPLSSLTTTVKSNSAAINSSSTGRVQFYDYNSKLAKEKDQASTTVSVQRQRDQSLPSAMEQAEQENQKERERQLEELKKLQLMEERGQKALEREQIRRDCNELTEKLEVLSQEYSKQLPTNDNQRHIFVDKQLRKEGKMNSAIEKLLQRPTIITCSEQNKPSNVEDKQKSALNEGNLGNLLNVASLDNKPLPTDDVSSDSCCSILLGYVDDQSKLVKQDLQKSENCQNQSKQKRLKDLLMRLDNLRNSLIAELKNESKFTKNKTEKESAEFSSKEDNLKRVIDNISELCKEREQIVISEKSKNPKSLREREKELEAKETLLEKKVIEFYELQKQQKSQDTQAKDELKRNISKGDIDKCESSPCNNINDEPNEVCASGRNPLEIIITVKGDTKCVTIPKKSKRKYSPKKAPTILSTLIRSPQPKKNAPKKKIQPSKTLSAQSMLRRQNSYDSNSTSYMSLPSELPTKIDDLVECIAKEGLNQANKANRENESLNHTNSKQNQQHETESSLESLNIIPRFNPPPRVNPLIAQYVHRLLGMSRDAVQRLGISSSEIETPDSSIINIASNVSVNASNISDDRLITLQNFIEENKSFIKDIEQSIISQNNASLENSLRKLDDIWRKRLRNENKAAVNSKNETSKKDHTNKNVKDNKIEQKTSLNVEKKKLLKDNRAQKINKTHCNEPTKIETKTTCTENLLRDLSKTLSSKGSTGDKESTRSIKIYKRSVETVDKAINAKISCDSSKNESDSQIARYVKLTENCTHRIAELTELISRVREEKQRLLEVTLSSVSDCGRQSTEYFELPEGKINARNEQDDLTHVSSSSEETTKNRQSLSSNTLHEMPKLSSADKNKKIAHSRDSGIAESRPVTALENRIDQEPISQTSSESTSNQVVRKMKPPPSLKRFSPQLPEDELAHELSTIFEVDTPATSRINTAAGQSAEERENALCNGAQQPIMFLTFDQYIQRLNLDLTQLDPEQSLKLQQEFTTFLECLQQNRLTEDTPKYSEFPTIATYLQELAECDLHLGETMEESLAKLHISGIQPDNFPAVREYIRRNESNLLQSDAQQFLDSESLENITDAPTCTNTDNDSASMDFQKELKKRNIIKNPFRVRGSKKKQISSSKGHSDTAFIQDILAAESGVDKLSTSGNTSDLLDSLKSMVQQFPGEERKKTKDKQILSSTTTSTNISALANSALRAASLNESSKESGQPLNLRDFLTRKLEKLAQNSGSSTNSSSDDFFRSHFLHSLLDTLSPRTPGAASKSGGQTLDRQKTSTPVPAQSSQAHSTTSSHSNSSSQLFSVESHLSSVRYQDRSMHFATSGDANADQSSG